MKTEATETFWSFQGLEKSFLAFIVIAATTAVMYLIGRDILGEGVIALLYLAPISWVTARWGQGPGIVAAVASALVFNFFFIPPYFTLYIGSLEGWLLLFIFLAVAIVIVGRIQVGLAMAYRREREAIFMYELSAALASAQTPEAITRILAGQTQQLYQAELVQVTIDGKEGPVAAISPKEASVKNYPDRVLPILTDKGIVGEIRMWQGKIPLPPADDRLFRNFTEQSARALARAQPA